MAEQGLWWKYYERTHMWELYDGERGTGWTVRPPLVGDETWRWTYWQGGHPLDSGGSFTEADAKRFVEAQWASLQEA